MYLLRLLKSAEKDKKLLKPAGLESTAKELLRIMTVNPWQTPPPYEKLVGDMRGSYSRRINKQHRIVYAVIANDEGLIDANGKLYDGIVLVKSMWGHYDD